MTSERELGDPSDEDMSEIKDLTEFLQMDAHSQPVLTNVLLEVWAMGHNQGYADAYTEQELQ